MTKDAVQRVIQAAVREAFRLGGEKHASHGARDAARASASTYAETLILPAAEAWAEDAREDGYKAGRTARLATADVA